MASDSQGRQPDPRQFHNNVASYSRNRYWPSRSYVEQVALQRMEQLLQTALAPETYDLDMANAMFTIVVQILDRAQIIDNDLWGTQVEFIKQLFTNRDTLCVARYSEGHNLFEVSKSCGQLYSNARPLAVCVPPFCF